MGPHCLVSHCSGSYGAQKLLYLDHLYLRVLPSPITASFWFALLEIKIRDKLSIWLHPRYTNQLKWST